MQEFFVKLNSFDDIRAFVVLATTQPFEVYAQAPSMRVSAKSFMGMTSLDYREPVQVVGDCSRDAWEEFRRAADRFLV